MGCSSSLPAPAENKRPITQVFGSSSTLKDSALSDSSSSPLPPPPAPPPPEPAKPKLPPLQPRPAKAPLPPLPAPSPPEPPKPKLQPLQPRPAKAPPPPLLPIPAKKELNLVLDAEDTGDAPDESVLSSCHEDNAVRDENEDWNYSEENSDKRSTEPNERNNESDDGDLNDPENSDAYDDDMNDSERNSEADDDAMNDPENSEADDDDMNDPENSEADDGDMNDSERNSKTDDGDMNYSEDFLGEGEEYDDYEEEDPQQKFIDDFIANYFASGGDLGHSVSRAHPDIEQFDVKSCPRASISWRKPTRCMFSMNKHVNVNAHYGAGAALLMLSPSCKPGWTRSHVMLLMFGFDGNHYDHVDVARSEGGKFAYNNLLRTDERGNLYVEGIYLANHAALLSNIPEYGALNHGYTISPNDEGQAVFPLQLRGNSVDKDPTGTSLVLCSGWEGHDHITALYMLTIYGETVYGECVRHELIKGQDKWTFFCNRNGTLAAEGLKGSSYGFFHNRSNTTNDAGASENIGAYTSHVQSVEGSHDTMLFRTAAPLCGCIVVLCSVSTEKGVEDNAAAAMYCLSISTNSVTSDLVKVIRGATYPSKTDDLWTFTRSDNSIYVRGAPGPCRYVIISNYSRSVPLTIETNMNRCLATGEEEPIRGVATVNDYVFSGWISKRRDIVIRMNGYDRLVLDGKDLKAMTGKFAFHGLQLFPAKPGLSYIRIFAKGIKADGSACPIELEGSPFEVIRQPKGVKFAVNCGGQAFGARNGIVYTSEFSHIINTVPNYTPGRAVPLRGLLLAGSHMSSLVTDTDDGFLYTTLRAKDPAAPEDEETMLYNIKGIAGNDYTYRFHTLPRGDTTQITESQPIADQQERETPKKKYLVYLAHTTELAINVPDDELELDFRQPIAAFALLEPGYKDEKEFIQDIYEDKEEIKKEKKFTDWELSGGWSVIENAYGSSNAFVTSSAVSIKYQQVDLTQYFNTHYLDTAPPIEAFEWHEDSLKGSGSYFLSIKLMNVKGQTVAEYNRESFEKQSEWHKEGHTFTNYGPGVVRLSFQSTAKSSLEHTPYEIRMTHATVRVKRNKTSDANDVFADVISDTQDTPEALQGKNDLIAKLLRDNNLPAEGTNLKLSAFQRKEEQDFNPLILANWTAIMDATRNTVEGRKAMEEKTVKKKRKKREVRVFVSSTFRDFKAEREQLIKKTFKEINDLCRNRGVFFTYVDLRWGITEDQTTKGETIAICLQEIERCRPYFICTMGQRFGWCQKERGSDELLNASFDYAVENFPSMAWVNDYRVGFSVTHLEIMHGVLNNPEHTRSRSFFYMRQPAVEGQGFSYSEIKDTQAESEWHAEKQEAFKQKIRDTEAINVRDYALPVDGCEMIKKDLIKCIEEDFPEGTELTALEMEFEAHEAFADARRSVYVGGEEYYSTIDAHMQHHKPYPLVIVGESGSGKSALLSNWLVKMDESQEKAFVFAHFVGSTTGSTSYMKLIRRLLEEMKQFYSFDLEVPGPNLQLISELPTWLTIAGSLTKCVIAIDALSQLDESAGYELTWLPRELPRGVFMLMTTTPGRAFEAVKTRQWPTITIHSLEVPEKEQILVNYMEDKYGKTLSTAQRKAIVDAEQTTNPLYLRVLLEEIRMFGNFRKLTNKIEDYLTAENVTILFSKILERIEEDFDSKKDGLVEGMLTAIWCSRKGMTEVELLELLNVPQAVWSPLYLSLVENLVNRNGLLDFFHNHLRQAVENKYLPTAENKQQAYKKLAKFFRNRPVDQRTIEELPYLLVKLNDTSKLKGFLSSLTVLKLFTKSDEGKLQLAMFWKMLGDSKLAVQAYKSALVDTHKQESSDTETTMKLAFDLAELFSELGLSGATRAFLEQFCFKLLSFKHSTDVTITLDPMSQSRKYKCKNEEVIDVLYRLGHECIKQNDLPTSVKYFNDAISRQNRIFTPSQKLQLVRGLLGLGTAYLHDSDNTIEAERHLLRAHDFASDVLGNKHHFVAYIYNKLGQMYLKLKEASLKYLVGDLFITRAELGTTHPSIATALNDIAIAYENKHPALAEDCYKAALKIFNSTYGNEHVNTAITRYNLGVNYFLQNKYKRAEYQFKEALLVYTMLLSEKHPHKEAVRAALKLTTEMLQA